MSELLSAVPHFNFSENIMGVLVGRVGRRSWDEVSNIHMCGMRVAYR